MRSFSLVFLALAAASSGYARAVVGGTYNDTTSVGNGTTVSTSVSLPTWVPTLTTATPTWIPTITTVEPTTITGTINGSISFTWTLNPTFNGTTITSVVPTPIGPGPNGTSVTSVTSITTYNSSTVSTGTSTSTGNTSTYDSTSVVTLPTF